MDISYGEEADKSLKQYGLPEAVETLIERGEYDNKESEVTKVSWWFVCGAVNLLEVVLFYWDYL